MVDPFVDAQNGAMGLEVYTSEGRIRKNNQAFHYRPAATPFVPQETVYYHSPEGKPGPYIAPKPVSRRTKLLISVLILGSYAVGWSAMGFVPATLVLSFVLLWIVDYALHR